MKKHITLFLTLIMIIGFFQCETKHEHAGQQSLAQYTCSMHPQIIQDKPGTCPICGMTLVKKIGSANQDNAIMLNESQIRLANITTTLTRFENIGESTLIAARLAVNEDQTELVSSRVEGRIEKMYFKEVGQAITKGQPLYEIYSESLITLQQEYLLAVRQLEELKDLRYESFVKSSEKKLLLFGLSQRQIDKLKQDKKVDTNVLFSTPASGVISKIDAVEGQYVSEGSSLYRMERLEQIWVEGDLYPAETNLVKIGDVVRVQVNGFENTPQEAKVIFLSPEYRNGSQIMTMRAVMSNDANKFMPGMQANIILSHSERKAIALPSEAVIRDANGSHVWVLGEDGAFRPRMVITGLENFDKVEITEGVQEKENVVISGAYLLYSELILKRGGDLMAAHHHESKTIEH